MFVVGLSMCPSLFDLCLFLCCVCGVLYTSLCVRVVLFHFSIGVFMFILLLTLFVALYVLYVCCEYM